MKPWHVEPDFAREHTAAIQAGFECGLLAPEVHFGGEAQVINLPSEGPVLYRGWILKPEQYAAVDAAIPGRLVTWPNAYRIGYELPFWYRNVPTGATPKSIWIPGREFDMWHVREKVWMAFGNSAVIVKDYVKSRKHEWYDSCFIQAPLEEGEINRVVGNFLEGQGDSLVGGLVFREFIEFERVGLHSKSRMPLINEWRAFLWRGRVFYMAPYWSEGEYSGEKPDPAWIESVTADVVAPFITADVARRKDGGWMLVEIGDGGSAGVPEGGRIEAFYQALFERLQKT